MYTLLDEKAPQFSIYALSKKHAEELARFYCSSNDLPLTILRPSQVYGNESSFQRHQPFFYSIIEKAEKGEDLSLYGSHDPSRNYIHIDDLVEIIARVVKNKVEGSYCCMHTDDTTYSKIANAAFAATGHKGTVQFLPDKPDIPDNIFEKDNSLYKKIEFYPRVSIDEGVQQLINYRKGQ
jgi:nucleoside-diphosphate-sugar epimerase